MRDDIESVWWYEVGWNGTIAVEIALRDVGNLGVEIAQALADLLFILVSFEVFDDVFAEGGPVERVRILRLPQLNLLPPNCGVLGEDDLGYEGAGREERGDRRSSSKLELNGSLWVPVLVVILEEVVKEGSRFPGKFFSDFLLREIVVQIQPSFAAINFFVQRFKCFHGFVHGPILL